QLTSHSFPTRRSSDLIVAHEVHVVAADIAETAQHAGTAEQLHFQIGTHPTGFEHPVDELFHGRAAVAGGASRHALPGVIALAGRSEEHTSELQSRENL